MPIKSTQLLAIRALRDGIPVTGSCRLVKYEHRKDDPASEGIPQREVLILDAEGRLVLKITKFFRHLLLESDGAFETTDRLSRLTPDEVQRMAETVLAAPGHREQRLIAAVAELDRIDAEQTDESLSQFD